MLVLCGCLQYDLLADVEIVDNIDFCGIPAFAVTRGEKGEEREEVRQKGRESGRNGEEGEKKWGGREMRKCCNYHNQQWSEKETDPYLHA